MATISCSSFTGCAAWSPPGCLSSSEVERRGGRWRGHARLGLDLLPPPPLRLNAFALHGTGEARRHLAAIPVPGPTPDFHRLALFSHRQLPGWTAAAAAALVEPVLQARSNDP